MNSEPDNKKGLTNDHMTLSHDILIVDDEVANLKLLKELLSRKGYKVRFSDRPQLAIDSALGLPPALILLDVKMPDVDALRFVIVSSRMSVHVTSRSYSSARCTRLRIKSEVSGPAE